MFLSVESKVGDVGDVKNWGGRKMQKMTFLVQVLAIKEKYDVKVMDIEALKKPQPKS